MSSLLFLAGSKFRNKSLLWMKEWQGQECSECLVMGGNMAMAWTVMIVMRRNGGLV